MKYGGSSAPATLSTSGSSRAASSTRCIVSTCDAVKVSSPVTRMSTFTIQRLSGVNPIGRRQFSAM